MNLMNMLGITYFAKGTTYAFLNPILRVLNEIIFPILIVLAAVGTIYAIYLGVMMAKAENAEKREEAKKRIINAVIALAVVVVLVALMGVFVQYAPDILKVDKKNIVDTYPTSIKSLIDYAKIINIK